MPSVLSLLPLLGIMGWALVLVVAHSSGRLNTAQALLMLAFPIVAVGVALRPAWVVLFMVAAPLAQIQVAPMRGLVLLMVATLCAQLIVKGSVSVGWRSGFLGLVLLLTVALFLGVDLIGNDALVARGMLNDLAFYVSLGLVSYNATRTGDLRGGHLVNAILFGLALSVFLDITVLSGGIAAFGTGVVAVGRPVAYLAVAGFALCFARLVTRSHDGSLYHPVLHAALGFGFFLVMIPGLVRGAWLSALLAVLFVTSWSKRKRYWILIAVAIVAILIVPVARERVIPNEEQLSSGGFTTGRLELWTRLWDEATPALPWGNGFGHMVTLDAEQLFGEGSTNFNPTGSGEAFVFPHNDFIFWMVELGFIGLVGMVLFWGQLMNACRKVLRSENERFVILLTGVLVAALVAQLVGSTFFFRALAVPFFGAAGFIFGTRAAIED